jgi:biopolymer transport protein ExbD
MAASTSNNDDDAITGINVTPLVDVTLVLLIIFMVTAKIMVSQAVPLDLPKAASGTDVQTIFSIELYPKDDEIVVDSKRIVNDNALLPLAREGHARNSDLRAVIKADSSVRHGRVMHVLDLLKQAGIAKIAFGVTAIAPEPVPGAAPPAPK